MTRSAPTAGAKDSSESNSAQSARAALIGLDLSIVDHRQQFLSLFPDLADFPGRETHLNRRVFSPHTGVPRKILPWRHRDVVAPLTLPLCHDGEASGQRFFRER